MRQVRVCEFCGYRNSLGTTYCENPDCGEDVSYLPITNLDEEQNQVDNEKTITDRMTTEKAQTQTIRMQGLTLVNTISGYELEIPVNGGVLGRSGTIQPEHFKQCLYVSNQHARITLTATGYGICDLQSTNGTKLNGQQLASGEIVPIQDGDRIVLANMEYVVRA